MSRGHHAHANLIGAGDVSQRPTSLHLFQEFLNVYVGVVECAAQGVAINLIVKRKDDSSASGVFHLDVTAPAMDFDEAEAL